MLISVIYFCAWKISEQTDIEKTKWEEKEDKEAVVAAVVAIVGATEVVAEAVNVAQKASSISSRRSCAMASTPRT